MGLYRDIKKAKLDSTRNYLVGVSFNLDSHYTVSVVHEDTMRTKFEYCGKIEIVPGIGLALINMIESLIPNTKLCIDANEDSIGIYLIDYLIDQGYSEYLFYEYEQDSNIFKGIIRRIKRQPRKKLYGVRDASTFLNRYYEIICNAEEYVGNTDCVEAYLMTVEAKNQLIWRS